MSREDQRWVIIGCEVVVVVWGITALIVSFFQCQLPTPWLYADDTRCIDRTAFWTYYSVANIATDIAIIAIMCRNVVRIHTSSSKKILVMTVFGSRILYVSTYDCGRCRPANANQDEVLHPQSPFKFITAVKPFHRWISPSPYGPLRSLYNWFNVSLSSQPASPTSNPSSTVSNPVKYVSTTSDERASLTATVIRRVTGQGMLENLGPNRARTARPLSHGRSCWSTSLQHHGRSEARFTRWSISPSRKELQKRRWGNMVEAGMGRAKQVSQARPYSSTSRGKWRWRACMKGGLDGSRISPVFPTIALYVRLKLYLVMTNN